MIYNCYGTVKGSKYLGQVKAANEDEAIEKAQELETTHVSFCHHCSGECEDPQIDEIVVEKE